MKNKKILLTLCTSILLLVTNIFANEPEEVVTFGENNLTSVEYLWELYNYTTLENIESCGYHQCFTQEKFLEFLSALTTTAQITVTDGWAAIKLNPWRKEVIIPVSLLVTWITYKIGHGRGAGGAQAAGAAVLEALRRDHAGVVRGHGEAINALREQHVNVMGGQLGEQKEAMRLGLETARADASEVLDKKLKTQEERLQKEATAAITQLELNLRRERDEREASRGRQHVNEVKRIQAQRDLAETELAQIREAMGHIMGSTIMAGFGGRRPTSSHLSLAAIEDDPKDDEGDAGKGSGDGDE